MYNRAEVIDQNFASLVMDGKLPTARSLTGLVEAGLRPEELVDLFESQLISRHLDLRARILKNENQCFYTIGSAGHEGNAAVAKAFRVTDMAFLHYRSGAFMVQRSKQLEGSTPIYDLMLSFVASADEPIAGGRHKVFGSHPLMVPPQTSTIASHLPKAMGAALSITRAKDLKIESVIPYDGVVACTFGDASANHSTSLGAINTASWIAYQNIGVPLVYICEDNGIGISVRTPTDWIARNFSNRPALEYIYCDGLNLCDVYRAAKQAVQIARTRKKPVFLHMKTVRLLGHAGSDMETSYSTLSQIEENEFNDPILHSARILIENHILTPEQVVDMYKTIAEQVRAVAQYATTRPKITDPKVIASTITACAFPKQTPENVSTKALEELWGKEWPKLQGPLHLAKLQNMALHEIMLQYPSSLVFGEDVAQKGGVYNVTDGLYKKFGSRRVFNSPLDEQSILGTAIGMAHNGFLPIPEIQFLAYVHNAEDQIRGEAATLAFFSQGQFTNGMVIRIAGLPYQKGFGGHFHNDNSLAVFRDIPGVIVAVPSNGADSVKMLRACAREAWEKGRVVVFVEPIALYMTRDLHESNDKAWAFEYPKPGEEIPIGEFSVTDGDSELMIITYGNGTYYSRQAAKILQQKHKINPRVLDLRWIAPIDAKKVAQTAAKSKHVLIVDECRKTGSLSEYLVATLVEQLDRPPRMRVLAADDCFIPLGVAAAAGLPSRDQIVMESLRLLNKV